jgi:hypothetical protein
MLTAEAVDDPGVVVWARDAARSRMYQCPGCLASPLVVKRGQFVVAHFAHPRGVEDCSSEPETALHLASKQTIAEVFGGVVEQVVECPVQHELKQGSVRRRADVLVPHTVEPFVVEVQLSPLTVEDFHERTGDYNRAGFPVLWIWDENVHGRRHGDLAGGLTYCARLQLAGRRRPARAGAPARMDGRRARPAMGRGDLPGARPCHPRATCGAVSVATVGDARGRGRRGRDGSARGPAPDRSPGAASSRAGRCAVSGLVAQI